MNPTVVNVQKTLSINVIGEQRIVEVEYVTVSLNVQGNLGAGAGTTVSYVAGTNLSALRAVTIDGAGQAIYANNDSIANATVVGVTKSSATTGSPVSICTEGIITDNAWNWVKGPVLLGTNGTLTQTPPAAGLVFVQVGRALTPTSMAVDVDIAIQTI